jgi:hypothetical protein
LDNAYAPNSGLGAGAIAGVTIGVILFALLVLAILWKCAPKFRKSVMYIQTDVIWKPRLVPITLYMYT